MLNYFKKKRFKVENVEYLQCISCIFIRGGDAKWT